MRHSGWIDTLYFYFFYFFLRMSRPRSVAALFFLDRNLNHLHRGLRFIVGIGGRRFDFLHDIHAGDDLTEDGML
jgi:hypothetical protein